MSSHVPEMLFELRSVQKQAAGPPALCMSDTDPVFSSPAQMEEVVCTEY